MNQNKSFKALRLKISAAYLVLPILIFLGILCFYGSDIFGMSWFRLIFAIFGGCWGLAMRGIYLRDHPANPLPFYVTLYPLVVIMNGFIIYTLLSLFKPFEKHLFFTAALPLGMYMGFFSDPQWWPFHWIFSRVLAGYFEKLNQKADATPKKT